MMNPTFLVTGANGIVGVELIRTWLRSPAPPRLVLLLRGDARDVASKRDWILGHAGASAEASARVEVVAGDVARSELGLDAATLERLRPEITGVLHAAASTSFQQGAEDADRHNVDGTRHALDFARSCPQLDRFGLVSTAFAVGRKTGPIPEAPFDCSAGFTTEYERSKAEAETLARKSGLPVAIYRLSLVVGRQTDGVVVRMNGLYPVWRIMHQGMLSMLPGDPAQTIDLIPVDLAAEAIVHLFGASFQAGAIVNVCAGRDRSFTLGALVAAMEHALSQEDPAWARKSLPSPCHVAPKTFHDFIDTVDLTANPRLRAIVRQQRLFTLQLEYPKTFETDAFDRALVEARIPFRHVRDWFPALARFALAVDWRPPTWESSND